MRCANGVPHSPHADFFKFAEVLVEEAGLRKLSKFVMDNMDGEPLLLPRVVGALIVLHMCILQQRLQ